MYFYNETKSLYIFILNILNSFNIPWKIPTNLTSLLIVPKSIFIWIFLRIIWKGYFLLNLLRGRPSQVAMVGSLKTNNLKILFCCIHQEDVSRRDSARLRGSFFYLHKTKHFQLRQYDEVWVWVCSKYTEKNNCVIQNCFIPEKSQIMLSMH